MKHVTLIGILAVAAAVSGCDKPDQANQKLPTSTAPLTELKVTGWGPQAAPVGTVPNKQPDGNMGIWIQVAGTQGLGEVQISFAGQAVKSPVIQEKLITIAVAPNQLAEPGDKEITIKQTATNNVFKVGVFKVVPAK